MALAAGTRLGAYEITALIGAGGMGEIYRARDTKLNRDVALKILPELFAADPERLARFKREAQLLASLNHPNIAAIYGFEEGSAEAGHHGAGDVASGFRRTIQALVLELVDGPTLADRIAQGPLPLDDALPIARQIAEALEAAHEQGIVHRDLKPANIKVRLDGTVKVLDFGLAKAFDVASGLSRKPQADEMTALPTITSPAATRLGTILGTAAYMSPEQARGKAVDKRTDIWAFGCVLYEILTGTRAFDGEDVTDVLARVLEREPDLGALPSRTPGSIQRLLRRCFEKDPRRRLRDIGDARIDIDESGFVQAISPARSKEGQLRGAALVTAATVIAALVAAIATRGPVVRPSATETPVTRVALALGSQRLVAFRGLGDSLGRYSPIAISQDGTKLAYSAYEPGHPPQIYVRALDRFDTRVLPGTDNAELPFFSPDGAWLGYLLDGTVFKVAVEGGIPIKIADVPITARGATWGPDNVIILGGPNTGLQRLDAAQEGGTPREITTPNSARGEQYHAWPEILPDGEHVLFTAVTGESSDLGVVSLTTGEWRILPRTEGAAQPRYLDTGHLVFFRSGGLFAAAFDPNRSELQGSAIPVLADVFKGRNAGLDIGYFAASRSGALLYAPAEATSGNRVVIVDRTGQQTPLIREPGRFGYPPALSRDGLRLVMSNALRPSADLWLHDIIRGTTSRLTSEGANIYPIWGPDDRNIFFAAFKTGSASFDLYVISADGSRAPEPLLIREHGQFPLSVSSDGQLLAFSEANPTTGQDIHLLALANRTTSPFATTRANEGDARFSPDGRFLAYSSDESGRYEVYVRSLTETTGKWTISAGGGRWPRWSRAGDEIFYMSGSRMMVTRVSREPMFRPESPQPLFEGAYDEWYDVTPDGRFVMIAQEQPNLAVLHLVVSWSSELTRTVARN